MKTTPKMLEINRDRLTCFFFASGSWFGSGCWRKFLFIFLPILLFSSFLKAHPNSSSKLVIRQEKTKVFNYDFKFLIVDHDLFVALKPELKKQQKFRPAQWQKLKTSLIHYAFNSVKIINPEENCLFDKPKGSWKSGLIKITWSGKCKTNLSGLEVRPK